jgi:NADH-quinone oxidoreductase subunit H
MMAQTLLVALVKILVLLGGVLTAAAYFVLVERRVAAWVQDRHGPNRVGVPLTKIRLFGLGQPIADGLKMIFKEEYTPLHVDYRLYLLAPITIMTAALAVYAVIPFGSTLPPIPAWGLDEPIPLMVAPAVDVGMIYVFALSSIAVYGVILGGWASNNKYSFLGGLRSSAQMIAYELPLGLGILGVVLATGSLRLDEIIGHQAHDGAWFALAQPLGFAVFLTAAFAEASRLPFDLPECEQELVGGFHTEYSGMKLVLFLTAEFIHMITAAFLVSILFLGGWHFWGLTGTADSQITWGLALLRILVLMVKIVAVIVFFMLARWTWPRFRFDQVMSLAWKVMLPLGIVNLVAVAILTELLHPQLFGQPLEARLGGWVPLLGCLTGWAVALVAWLVVAWAAPTITDNRPQRQAARFEIDTQV